MPQRWEIPYAEGDPTGKGGVFLHQKILGLALPLLLVAQAPAIPDAWFSHQLPSPPATLQPADPTPGQPDAWFLPLPEPRLPGTRETSTPSTTPVASASVGSAPSGTEAADTSDAARFLALVNQARANAGLGPLAVNPLLDQLALTKAEVIVATGDFTDDPPGLGLPIDQEEAAGFYAVAMGAENLAEAADVTHAFLDLMASPPHAQNILDPVFTQTGLAVLPITGGILVVQFFAGPSLTAS